jgi:hypothetical protein
MSVRGRARLGVRAREGRREWKFFYTINREII